MPGQCASPTPHAPPRGRGGRAGLALLALLATGIPSRGDAQTASVSTRDSYQLRARLAPNGSALEGHASIRWHNRSAQPLGFLMFHLYANAFAHGHTVFMREQGSALRGEALTRRGGIDVLSLRDAAGADLLTRASTALEKDDATQLRVDLPRPLAPGASILLELSFRVRLPSIVARMGATDDFAMIAQWFPKLAKLEPDGRWASFPYHGLGEFYADFADYDLSVEVPQRFVVAAPGELLERVDQPDGFRRERYLLGNALDIAWAAHPDFVCTRNPGAPSVDVCAPRGHLRLAHAQAALLRRGLGRLGRMLGPYPYRRLMLVVPPRAGWGAAGMEYPGLIVGWPATPLTELNPVAMVLHDVTTAHELAHQWFPITVASNEVETPVLDEGLAEWLGLDLLRHQLGRPFFERALGLPVDLFDMIAAPHAHAGPARSSLDPAYRYRADELTKAVYVQPALALEAIGRTWGSTRLETALGSYARDNRFEHPGLQALFASFDRAYWVGFSRQTLRPALEGKPNEQNVATASSRPTDHRSLASAWSARLLLWAQALLAVVGP
jgi:hypothetical protein